MKHFTIDGIERLVDVAGKEPSTGDAWLDAKYLEDVPIIAHTNPYYKWFFLIAQIYQPEFTVELGTYLATGASHFAAGNPDGYVVTIDVHREDKAAQQKAIEAAAHYPNLVYLNGWTTDGIDVDRRGQWESMLPRVKLMGKPIDILFIDAWHEYRYAMREWQDYSPLLNSPALVICDDIFDAEGATVDMVKFWNEVSAPYEHRLLARPELHHQVPIGFFKYER